MPTIAEDIVADNDDGGETGASWFLDKLRQGDFTYDYLFGARFQGVAIPQGATIDAATLTLDRTSDSGSSNKGRVFGNDADTAPAWSGGTVRPGNMTKTSAFTQIVSPADPTVLDVAAIVQEIVNRAGWVSGNHMAFGGGATSQNGGVIWTDYYDDPASSPNLDVTYTAGAGGLAPPFKSNSMQHMLVR